MWFKIHTYRCQPMKEAVQSIQWRAQNRCFMELISQFNIIKICHCRHSPTTHLQILRMTQTCFYTKLFILQLQYISCNWAPLCKVLFLSYYKMYIIIASECFWFNNSIKSSEINIYLILLKFIKWTWKIFYRL